MEKYYEWEDMLEALGQRGHDRREEVHTLCLKAHAACRAARIARQRARTLVQQCQRTRHARAGPRQRGQP